MFIVKIMPFDRKTQSHCGCHLHFARYMSHSKAFSQCSFSDIALAISVNASASRVFEPYNFGDIFPPLRNTVLTDAVLLRYPLVRDCSGLKCNASASSKRVVQHAARFVRPGRKPYF